MKTVDDREISEVSLEPETESLLSKGMFMSNNSLWGIPPINLSDFWENSNDLILFVNANNKIDFVNNYVNELTGYKPVEVLGRNVFSFLEADESKRVKTIIKRIISTRGKFSLLRIDLLSKNKGKLTIEVNGMPVINKFDDLTGYFCIIRNITERETAEKQLASLVDELKDSIARKDKFFSLVAHDLKNPFHGLLGISAAALNEFHRMKPDELRHYLSSIYKSSKSIYSLVEDLLEWARLQTNRYECIPEKLDLFTEVNKALSALKENADNKKIVMQNNVKSNVNVHADQRMLQSILLNLISNAIKFTKPEGSVSVESSEVKEFVKIKIIDTGIGMSKENLEKLFRIDAHFSTSGTQRETGTGLGLLLCKEQVELNGGEIYAESELNAGSSFIFTLQKI